MGTSAFDEIVLPLDLAGPYDAVLELSSVLARRAGVAVRLVTVASPGLDHHDDEADLRMYASKVDVAAVPVEVVESNDVVAALIAATGHHGLLVVETRAHGPLAAVVLGSTTNALLRATTTPVLLVGPATDAAIPLYRMLVALDTPPAAERLIPIACAWACQAGLQLRFVHAPAGAGTSSDGGDDLVAAAVRRATGEFGVDADGAVITGRTVATAIVDEAARCGAGIVVVGMRSRPAALRVALGSEAVAVAHATHAAVLAVPLAHGGDASGDS